MMVHAESERSRDKIQHVYLHGAVALRPDLTGAQ
jgi:chorismate mutase